MFRRVYKQIPCRFCWMGEFYGIIDVSIQVAANGFKRVTIVAHHRTIFTHAGWVKTIYLEINICYFDSTCAHASHVPTYAGLELKL